MIRTSLFIALALSCFAGVATAKNYLEDYLPETTLFSFSLDDSTSLVAALENGELSKLVSEDQKETWLEDIKEPLEIGDGKRFKLPNGEEVSMSNLNELLSGRICVAVVSLDAENEMEPAIVLMADFAGEIDALKFLQISDRDESSDEVLLVEEEYAGITLFTEEIVGLPNDEWMAEYWTLVDGIAIEATSLDLLKNTVDAVIDSRNEGLGNTPAFLRAIDLSSDAQMRGFVNLKSGTAIFREFLDSDIGDLPMNPLAVTSDSLWTSLALDSMDAVFVSFDYESQDMESVFGLLYQERAGLLSMLAYSQDPVRYPHWVPKDAVASTVSMIDFPEVFAAFESVMNIMSPNFGSMFQLQLDNFREQSDIDMRESLMNNFGDQFISFTVWKELEEDVAVAIDNEQKIIAIPVRDPQAFQNAIKGLTEIFMPGTEVLTEREFLDLIIITPANHGMEDAPFGYALADGYLFLAIGSVDLLERTLYHVRESSEGLWNQSYIVDALRQFPPNPVESNYFNLGTVLEEIFKLYQNELSDDFDFDMPDFSEVELPYYMISTGYIIEGAQLTRARILPKKP
ncbi:hypothetical protein [Cerasicoccus arenae]|uniref:DUF3352 domain-containing protein n=1 Tax=Cerasicoccus arenae TaxID=424488 RepID=A0A8J3GFK4_9BACT|nr:hypothetical protein [Cerasicoccus arenae]MBK1856639.1 hypothetical protein [Cerasicoccus arenae]GHC12294.1 hypothetical protein GCM10007047_32070 [Cerasicoccus arenae]